MSESPDHVGSTVAAMAIAWEITKRIHDPVAHPASEKEEKYLATFEAVYKRVIAQVISKAAG
jgi:hypothetical protein